MILAALTSLLGGEALAEEIRYALVFGNNIGNINELPLQYAEDDAQRFAEVLVRHGGVDPGNVTLLKDASADQVLKSLERLNHRIESEAGPTDQTLLFVYYSGHADQNALHMGSSELALSDLHDAVKDSSASIELLLVDACRSGALLRLKGGTIIEPFEIRLRGGGMAILTSSSENEDAQESERLKGGVFTHHLIGGLKGAADTSGDARVSLYEVYQYTFAQTLQETTAAPVLQHPSYDFDLQGEADLILTTPQSGPRLGQLQLANEGLYVVFDAAGALIHEVEMLSGGSLTLPSGKYRVMLRRPDRADEAEVVIKARETTPLASSQMSRLPMGQVARRGDTREPHSSLALTMGTGVLGPAEDDLRMSLLGVPGVRLEMPWLTLMLRGRYGYAQTPNDFLTNQQQTIGAQLGALRLWDMKRFSFGAGVIGGSDLILQEFDTTGTAESRTAVGANLAAVGRVEWAAAPRWTVGLELAPESTLLPGEDGGVETHFLPRASLDVSFWLR